MAQVTISSDNAYEAYILNETWEVYDYCQTNGLGVPVIGEYTIPHGGKYTPNSNGQNGDTWGSTDLDPMLAAWSKWEQMCDILGIERYIWAGGYTWDWGWPNYHEYNPYRTATQSPGTTWSKNNSASTFEQYGNMSINLASIEFGPPYSGSANAHAVSDLQYLYDQGVRRIRLVIGQHHQGGSENWVWDNTAQSLRTDEMENIRLHLNRCQQVGLDVMLSILHPDLFNEFGKIEGNSIAGTTSTVGPGYNDYIEYAKALLNESIMDHTGATVDVKDHPAVISVDPCNEPHSGFATDPDVWQYCMQQIFDDFRDAAKVNYQGPLLQPSFDYSHLYAYISNYRSVTDSANNKVQSVHFYTDYDRNGVNGENADSWADYLANVPAGYGSFSRTFNVNSARRIIRAG